MENEITIRIKTLNGHEEAVPIGRSATVGELKGAIETRTQMPPSQQRIIFQGRCLTDDMTCASAGLDNHSVVHVVERPPPSATTTQQQSSPAQPESERRGAGTAQRNRIRSQLERHTAQFVAAIEAVDTRATPVSQTPPQDETDMASLARQLTTIAGAVECLPDYLRQLAEQVRQDPEVAPPTLTSSLHQLTTITQRLGALSSTIGNLQVPLTQPPPRRLEMSRRLPSSLSNLSSANGGVNTATQSFVIPVVQGVNGPEVGAGGGAHLQQQIQSHIAGLMQGLQVADEPEVDEQDPPPPNGQREPTLAARVMTMISRPADASGAPLDEGAINANITINANVQPNVTIRIYPEAPVATDQPLPHGSTQNTIDFVEQTAEDAARQVPALNPEIISQIRDSVANMNEGRPVIIEAENQNTNDEIGRVVGEAVRQTFHSLSNQVQASQQQQETSAARTTATTTSTTTTTTRSENGQVIEREHQQRQTVDGHSVEESDFKFNAEQLNQSFLDYLGTPGVVANPILSMVRNMLNVVTLDDVVTTVSTGTATERIVSLARKMASLGGMLESGMKMTFRLFFEPLLPIDVTVDLVQTNLSLLRSILTKLPNCDPEQLATLLIDFIKSFFKLNRNYVQNGQTAISSRLAQTVLFNAHAIAVFEKLDLVCSTSIDKFVVYHEKEKEEVKETPQMEEDPVDEEIEEDPIDEELEEEQPVALATKAPQSTQQRNEPRVIEVTEDVIPSAWRQVMMVDRRKMEAASAQQPIHLSTIYQTLRK